MAYLPIGTPNNPSYSVIYKDNLDAFHRLRVSFPTTLFYPLIAMRLKSGYDGAMVIPKQLSLLVVQNKVGIFKLLMNPTVTGTALSFTGLTNSAIEYDISRTKATTITGGTPIHTGVYSNNAPGTNDEILTPDILRLGSKIDGTKDILVLAVASGDGTAIDHYGSIVWTEYY